MQALKNDQLKHQNAWSLLGSQHSQSKPTRGRSKLIHQTSRNITGGCPCHAGNTCSTGIIMPYVITSFECCSGHPAELWHGTHKMAITHSKMISGAIVFTFHTAFRRWSQHRSTNGPHQSTTAAGFRLVFILPDASLPKHMPVFWLQPCEIMRRNHLQVRNPGRTNLCRQNSATKKISQLSHPFKNV